jgi:hypothetical protein
MKGAFFPAITSFWHLKPHSAPVPDLTPAHVETQLSILPMIPGQPAPDNLLEVVQEQAPIWNDSPIVILVPRLLREYHAPSYPGYQQLQCGSHILG